MAVNINLYPPIVETYIPAFIVDSEDVSKNICRIYFSLSMFNSVEEIKNVQITVRNQYTNLSVLNKTNYPCEVMLKDLQVDLNRSSDDKYYIEIQPEDIQGGQFEINQYYKVQIRFTGAGAADVSLSSPQAIDSWLAANINYFSEWSTVCLIRGISEPDLEVRGFELDSSGYLAWSNANPTIFGELVFKNPEETEKLKSYQIKLFNSDNNTLLTDSGILYSSNENNPNAINYTLKYNFMPGNYYFTIEYTTYNLYKDSYIAQFKIADSGDTAPELTISAVEDDLNGRILINLKKSSITAPFSGTLILRRTGSNSNFTYWDDLKTYTYENAQTIKEEFSDTTIESGVWYKYCIQKINSDGTRGGIKYLKNSLMVLFEDMFLTSKDRQLNIKFNPTLNSFKKVIQESRTDTLGSQFPFVRRNGHANYAQFPIGGLISFQIDEVDLFTSLQELFGDNLNLYTSYNDSNRITEANDIVYEKLFRDRVMEFLYDEDPKLFRSATEGNFIVKIMDVSLTPNATLGRRIWSFNATAYEVAECTIENYIKYNILEGND